MRVLFSSVAAPSHVGPMLPLARAVAAEHEVVFATGPALLPAVERAGLRGVAAGLDWSEPEAERTFPELSSLALEDTAAWWYHEIFLDRAGRPMARDLTALIAGAPFDVVVRTQLEFGGWAAAVAHGLPQVVLGLGGTHRAEDLPDMHDRLIGLLAAAGASSAVDGPSTFGDLFLALHPEVYDDWVPPVPWMRCRPPVPFPGPGGRPSPPPELAAADGRPVLLITFGTVFNRTPGAFEVVLAALADLPVFAVVTVGDTRNPADLGPVPRNVRVHRYVPYDRLLPHCDAVVCHGGYSTVMGALAHGLPLVIVPLSADQPWHAELCREAGVAETTTFPEVIADWVRGAVARVLDDDSYRTAAARQRRALHELPPLDAVVPQLVQLATSRSTRDDASVRRPQRDAT